MKEKVLDFTPVIMPHHIAELEEEMTSLKDDASLIIRMELADAHQSDRVVELLQEQGFTYETRGDGTEYLIVAQRQKGR